MLERLILSTDLLKAAPRTSKTWPLPLESSSAPKWLLFQGIKRLKFKFGTQVHSSLFSWARTVSCNYLCVCYHRYSHYRKAQGALVVYDITKEYTFKNVKKWI